MLSNGSALTARPRSRPLRREFVTTICTEDLGRYAGLGLTRDQVIAEELQNIAATPISSVEECDDLVIWEGNKVVALIRIGLDRRPIVTRFDPPAPRPAEPGADDAGYTRECSPLSELALKVTRDAAVHYLAMKRRAEEAHDRYREVTRDGAALPRPGVSRSQGEPWVDQAREAAIASERHLYRCILLLNGKVESLPDLNSPGFRCPPCGVMLDDHLYLALGGEAGSTPVVVELRDVPRLDAGGPDAPPGKD
jgi:hypothetical protein